MDPKVFGLIDDSMPKFNEMVVDGFHKREFDRADKFFENILKMIFQSIEKRGVIFKGVKRVKPDEMFNVLSMNTGSRYFETHKESLYPCKIMLDYRDNTGRITELKPAYIFLPFTDRFGDIWIRGTQYSLQMVLVDRGLSVTKEDMIFVKLLGYKFKIGVENFTFNKVHTEVRPNKSTPISLNLPSNRFYQAGESRKVSPVTTPTPLLAWYIFAEYGFDKAVTEFGDCDYQIGSLDYLTQNCDVKEGWSVYTSTGKIHNKMITPFVDLDVAVAVRPKSKMREGEIPTVVLQYIGALLFAVDTVPAYFGLNKVNDSVFWKYVIGKCSFKSKDNVDVVMRYMNEHWSSMEEYLDELTIQHFAAQRIVVKNMYEFFNHIIINRTEIVRTADRASVLHKCLSSLEFTMDKLITSANQFKHEIKNTTELNLNKVTKMVTRHFHLRGIEKATNDANLIQEATPTDNPLCDYMLGLVSQSKVFKARGGNSGDNEFNPNDPATFIHASVAFGCSYQRVTDPDPDARGFLNPCVGLTSDKYIAVKPERRELYDATTTRLNVREPRK